MYQASCDLQPDSNMFCTTKKCIGELYESCIELHPSILPTMPDSTSWDLEYNSTHFKTSYKVVL